MPDRPDPRALTRSIERPTPLPQPNAGVAMPPQTSRGPIADRSPPRDERDGRGSRMPDRRDPRTATRSLERPTPLPQPTPGVAMTPRAPDRAAEPPRRLERRPEPARVERPAEPARIPAPQVAARPPAPELRRDAPPQAPVVRASPQATLPQFSFPRPGMERGEARVERGGRGEAREWRGGGERRGAERR
jgi:hypothetical protein